MDSSSVLQTTPPASRYASRTSVRRAVFDIIRRVLLTRLAQHRAAGTLPASATYRLNKAQRRRAVHQANLLEDILYRRAECLDDYQDSSTLESRVFRAGRAVFITSQRREMQRARTRTQGAQGASHVETESSVSEQNDVVVARS